MAAGWLCEFVRALFCHAQACPHPPGPDWSLSWSHFSQAPGRENAMLATLMAWYWLEHPHMASYGCKGGWEVSGFVILGGNYFSWLLRLRWQSGQRASSRRKLVSTHANACNWLHRLKVGRSVCGLQTQRIRCAMVPEQGQFSRAWAFLGKKWLSDSLTRHGDWSLHYP